MLSFKTYTRVKKQKRNSEFFSFLLLTDVFKAEAGRKIKILFSTKDAKGHLFYEADDQVDVTIQAPSGNFVKKKIEDNLNGNYTVSFTSDIVGPHSVTITVNGQPLTGSPWSVEVSPYQYKLAFDITVDTKRSFSRAIAVNKETNEIAVTQDELVLILSADHSLVRHFWLEEIILSMDFTINGSFVAILPSNFDKKLYLIGKSGKSIKEIGQEYLTWPTAVSVSHDGSIIVCDSSVKVFSPDGTKLLQSFNDSHFSNFPRFSVYHQDMFFVSYTWRGACVKTFSKYGVFLYDIDGEGSTEGGLTRPGRLAIDKFDNLIVSEEKTLKVFTVEGNFLYKIEVKHKENAIAASNTGNLYVVNEDCIRVFQ